LILKSYNRNDKQFEWYHNFESLRDIITQHIKHDSNLLNIGCGNSKLSEDMFIEGYKRITNLDFSKTVIQFMAMKYHDYPHSFRCICFLVILVVLADARELPFEDEEFDCVIDKGLLDAVLSGDYSASNSKKVLTHVNRVLKKQGGVYIVISHGFPENRLPYL